MSKATFSFLLAISLGPQLFAQPGALDPTFNPNDIGFANGDGGGGGQAVVIQPDGKVLVAGGRHTPYNGTAQGGLTRLTVDGLLDPSFATGTGFEMEPGSQLGAGLQDVLVQPNGDILAAGQFDLYDGTPRRCIARLHSDGSVDETFDPGSGPNDLIMDLALQADGKVVVVGRFDTFNGVARNGMARLNADGTLDMGFDPGVGADVDPSYGLDVVDLMPGGDILVGGHFTQWAGEPHGHLVRLNNDGSLDDNFDIGTGFDGPVYGIAVRPNGRILVAGYYTQFHVSTANGLVQLHANGSLDEGFSTGTGVAWGNSESISALLLQANGDLLCASGSGLYNGVAFSGIFRLHPDGTRDEDFNTGFANEYGSGKIRDLAVRPDGRIIAVGEFNWYSGEQVVRQNATCRLLPDGSHDMSFNTGSGADGPISCIAPQADGRIMLGGTFSRYNGVIRNGLARILPNGTLDPSFDPGAGLGITTASSSTQVNAIVTLQDGSMIIAGRLNWYDGEYRSNAFHIHADGSLDPDFQAGFSGMGATVCAVAAQPDGKIIFGGNFWGLTTSGIRRVNADGSNDASFVVGTGTGSGMYGSVYALAIQPDGKVLAAGNFTQMNNILCGMVTRLNDDASIDPGFAMVTLSSDTLTPAVRSMILQPDGRILISGRFSTVNGAERENIARLNSDGTIDETFDPETDAEDIVSAIALQADGRVLVLPTSEVEVGLQQNTLTRLNSDGTLDGSFIAGSGSPYYDQFYQLPPTLSLHPDGRALIGGQFTSYDGQGRNRVAAILTDNSTGLTAESGHANGVYPNPTRGVLNLTLEDQGPAVVVLTDAHGRELHRRNLPAGFNRYTADLSNMPPGLYHFRVISGDRVSSHPVVRVE